MDPVAIFAVPMLSTVYQVLVNTGWDALKRWRSGRKEVPFVEPETGVLRGELGPLRLGDDTSGMLQLSEDLEFLQESYGEAERLDPHDEVLRAVLGRLRHNLEVLFGQRITFQGEDNRPESGTQLGTDQRIESPVDVTITAAKKRLPDNRVIRQIIHNPRRGEIIGFDGGSA